MERLRGSVILDCLANKYLPHVIAVDHGPPDEEILKPSYLETSYDKDGLCVWYEPYFDSYRHYECRSRDLSLNTMLITVLKCKMLFDNPPYITNIFDKEISELLKNHLFCLKNEQGKIVSKVSNNESLEFGLLQLNHYLAKYERWNIINTITTYNCGYLEHEIEVFIYKTGEIHKFHYTNVKS